MVKTLKVKNQSKCVGCELCVFESQRQLNKVGLDGSLIRILRNRTRGKNPTDFGVEIDPRISELDIEKISKICPTQVFEISEEENGI